MLQEAAQDVEAALELEKNVKVSFKRTSTLTIESRAVHLLSCVPPCIQN